jgi:hypothetical protein
MEASDEAPRAAASAGRDGLPSSIETASITHLLESVVLYKEHTIALMCDLGRKSNRSRCPCQLKPSSGLSVFLSRVLRPCSCYGDWPVATVTIHPSPVRFLFQQDFFSRGSRRLTLACTAQLYVGHACQGPYSCRFRIVDTFEH